MQLLLEQFPLSKILKKKMKSFHIWIQVYLLSCLIYSISAASATPIWVASSFFKAGAVSFVFSSPMVTNQSATIAYSSALTNPSLKTPTLSFTDLDYSFQGGRMQLKIIVVSCSQSGLRFEVEIGADTILKVLKLTYMALDSSFQPAFSMNYFFPQIFQNGTIAVQYHVNFTQSTGVILNTSHENVLLPFMHYIDLEAYDGLPSIRLNFSVLNSSYYSVLITSPSKMYLRYAGFSRLIFDKTAIEAMGSDYFNYGIVVSQTNNLSTTIPPDIITENLYYGMHSFTLKLGISCFAYSSSYNVSSGFMAFLNSSNCGFAIMRFSYMHHKTRTCPPGYPYYNISELLCYDVCGLRWQGYNATFTCKPCLYDCYTCSDQISCLSCSADLDFRRINSTRCIPIDGYYDNGSTTAIPCLQPCANCLNVATYCLSCVSEYYISGHQCLLCSLAIHKCVSCSSSDFCTLCQDGTSGSSCTICKADQYLDSYSYDCLECNQTVDYCSACSRAYNCTLCQDTFVLNSPTQCICPNTHYLSVGQCLSCASAIDYCTSCSASTSCTICETTFVLLGPTQCGCQLDSYLNSAVLQCKLCKITYSNCYTCTNVQCSTCITGFLLINKACKCASGKYSQNESCLSCSTTLPNCVSCDNSSVCANCSSGYVVNSNGTCQIQPCQIPFCLTCNNANYSECIICDAGYTIVNNTCSSFCGNGNINSLHEECDDGNIINGDGCNSYCKIQSGFSCAGQYVSDTLTYSSCYYSDKISFENVWIRKLEDENTIKLAFKLKQKIDQWASVDFNSILSIDSVDPITNFTQGRTHLLIDTTQTFYQSSSNRFFVLIKYKSSLQGLTLRFALNPYEHSTYPIFTMPVNVQIRPSISFLLVKIQANNNQNANYYSQYDYQQYNNSKYICLTILILVGIGAFIALVSGKGRLIILQMFTLLQITYLSLSFLDSMNPVFAGLLPLRYITGIFGFNNIQDYLQQINTPNSIKGIYLFQDVSMNFSWSAIALAIIIGLGCIMWIIWIIIDYFLNPHTLHHDSLPASERRGYWLYRISFIFLGQLSLWLLIGLLPLFTFSFAHELFYSSSFSSYGEIIGVFLCYVVYSIALFKESYSKSRQFNRMGELMSEFRPTTLLNSFKYAHILLISTLVGSLLAIGMVEANQRFFSPLCLILVAFIEIILITVIKPYKFGFVSCCQGDSNESQAIFQKIELYKVYEKQQQNIYKIEAEVTQVTQQSQQNDLTNNSEIFAQHFNTKSVSLKSKHQGLIQAGEVLNHPSIYLFNNNFRRIFNLTALILVQIVFLLAQIFQQDVTRNSSTVGAILPLALSAFLLLTVSYNLFAVCLQVLDRTHANLNVNREKDHPDSSSQFTKSIYLQTDKRQEEQSTPLPFKQSQPKHPANRSMYELKRPQLPRPFKTGRNLRAAPKPNE